MPALLLAILRQAIMALVTGAAVTAVQEVADGTVKQMVYEIKDKEGLTETESKDIVNNMLADLAVNSLTIGTLLRTRLPVKTADFLGITNKTIAKKALSRPAALAASRLSVNGGAAVAKSMLPKVFKIAAIPASLIWLVSALANIVEPGIYKPEQTNAVYKKLGIPFEYPVAEGKLQPGPFDGKQFEEYAKALETAGVLGFEDPFALQSREYSRQALADLINGAYAEKVLQGFAPSARDMMQHIQPYIVGPSGTGTTSVPGSGVATTKPPASTGGGSTTSASGGSQGAQVFVGTISQGKLGGETFFTPRQDDLIESIAELQAAMQNNLSPFLTALMKRFSWEVRLSPSITTADGFKQSGITTRIIDSYTTGGLPKYKTVTNKFAVLSIFMTTQKGTRTRVGEIVLGPTNAVKFNPSQLALRQVEKQVQSSVITTDINDVQSIETKTPITVVPPAPEKEKDELPKQEGKTVQVDQSLIDFWSKYMPEGGSSGSDDGVFVRRGSEFFRISDGAKAVAKGAAPAPASSKPPTTTTQQPQTPQQPTQQAQQPAPASPTVSSTARAAALKATNLSQYYQALGQSLPGISARSQTYSSLGLGQAAYYTGTAEQNTKLLSALKARL